MWYVKSEKREGGNGGRMEIQMSGLKHKTGLCFESELALTS